MSKIRISMSKNRKAVAWPSDFVRVVGMLLLLFLFSIVVVALGCDQSKTETASQDTGSQKGATGIQYLVGHRMAHPIGHAFWGPTKTEFPARLEFEKIGPMGSFR